MSELTVDQILQMTWVEAPSETLSDSGMVWTPAPQARPLHRPVREREQPRALTPQVAPPGVIVRPEMPRALIPHIAMLTADLAAVLDPSSVEALQQCGNMYLCRFVRVARRDPVMPIVGLNWPTAVWQSEHPTVTDLRRGYRIVLRELESEKHFGDDTWREWMAVGVNKILTAVSQATAVTDVEYAYVQKHLIGAMRDPVKYTRGGK